MKTYKFDNGESLSIANKHYEILAESLPEAWDKLRKITSAPMTLANRAALTGGQENGSNN